MNLSFKNISLFIILLFGLLIFSACPKPQNYPDIPQIKFKQVVLFDTVDALGSKSKAYKLVFGIIDGDGDIGLQTTDTIGVDVDTAYVNDFLTIFYEVKNGDTIMTDSLNGYNYRIPYVVPQGQNKTLLADIYIDYLFAYDTDNNLKYDSVMFKFYVIDRKLNKSNLEKTPVLSLKSIGEFPQLEN